MIIVDTALRRRQEEGNPVRLAMVGAGAMGRGIALQILTAVPGMRLVAISNRHADRAKQIYLDSGATEVREVTTVTQLEEAVAKGQYAITDDPILLCEADGIDAVLEVTGAVDFSALTVLKAIENGKHIITMNAELQSTIGPILKTYALKAGVVFTDSDGDQPGVIMNLYRFVSGIGCNPVLAGNMKGLQDPYRTPTTQEVFARKHHLTPQMATSFADGSKVSFEMAIVANATGFKVGKRGMYGPPCDHVQEARHLFPMDQLLNGGLVDYILGAEPGPGVFVLGYQEHPLQKHYLSLYKMGDGPLYTFYRPYHLCHFEVPLTVARAVLFRDAAVTPLKGPVVDVVTTAKRDLRSGEVLDGIGQYMTYGQCENSDITDSQKLLPMGLAEGCRLKHNISKDQILTYDDVELPEGRLCDELRAEQNTYFAQSKAHFSESEAEKAQNQR